MKTSSIAVPLLLIAASALRAQVVNDSTTNTLSNVTNNITGDVTVGTNGSFTLLILSDNALLTNSVNGLIGRNDIANSNEVRLVSPSARWFMGGSLFVGTNGAANRLVVSNGATVLVRSSGTIGHGGGFGGNANGNSATVSGPGSLWSNGLELIVGELGFANRLEVNDGGSVVSSNAVVGRSSFSPSNTVVVAGPGSVWSNRADVSLGGVGSRNLLVVSNGGWMVNSNANIGESSLGNLALVTGNNSTWSNRGDLYVGNGARDNQLVVSNGARVIDNNGILGKTVTSSNNFALVTDSGSVWTNRSDLNIGVSGPNNQLVVSNSGWVASRTVTLGQGNTTSTSNFALVTGIGSVWSNATSFRVGGFAGGNRLVIEAGGLVYSDSSMLGDVGAASNNEAVVTGPGSLWTNVGFLTVGSQRPLNRMVVSNGAAVRSGTGTVGSGTNQVIVTGAGSIWSNQTYLFIGGTSNRVEANNGGWLAGGDGYLSGNSNTVVLSGNGSGWNNLGSLLVGDFGNGHLLLASNGATVLSSNAMIGSSTSLGDNNSAVLTGAGTLWSNRNELTVGNFSDGNRLVVSGGALLVSSNGYLGFNTAASSNTALVTDPGSFWNYGDRMRIGNSGTANSLVVSNGGVIGGVDGSVGEGASSSNNTVVVTGANSAWTNLFNFRVGSFGRGNRLIVENGGQIANDAAFIGALGGANAALLTGAGTRWTTAEELVVGDQSSANQLAVSNGAILLNTDGFVGNFTTASNNLALVTGSGSLWSNAASLSIGRFGSGNLLVISNAGTVVASNILVSYSSVAFSNRLVVDGGTLRAVSPATNGTLNVQRGTNVLNTGLIEVDQLLLTNVLGRFVFNGGTLVTRRALIYDRFTIGLNATAAPAVWNVLPDVTNTFIYNDIFLGSAAPFSQLILTNGARLTNDGLCIMGQLISSSSNSVTLADAGSQWSLTDGIWVGDLGSGNRLVVSNGASLVTSDLSVIGNQAVSSNNQAIITGPGTTWNGITAEFELGGRNSRLLVNNGAVLSSLSGLISYAEVDSTNNAAIVEGVGSSWANATELRVGSVGAANQLMISNNAVVSAGNAVFTGFSPTSTNNRVVVTSGALLVTNGAGTGVLEVRRGTNVLNSGWVEADILRMTNGVAGRFEFNSGTLSVKSSRVANGPPLFVGDGVNPATFNLAGNGTHDFSGTLGLIVRSNATLTGNGSLVVQLQVLAGARLIPGTSVGKMSLSTPPFLSGTVLMEISKNGTVLTNDQLQVTGTLTYGGALVVSNLGPGELDAGDRFQLFLSTSYAGAFTSLTLPPLRPGLEWRNNLLVDGSIHVFQPATTGAGFALKFDGTNGYMSAPHTFLLNYRVLIASAWINTTQTLGQVGLINKYVAGSSNGWQIGLVNGNVRAWYIADGTHYVWDGGLGLNGGNVADGQWHHVAFAVDETTGGRLYVDGGLKDSRGWTGTPLSCTTTQELSLGRYPGGSGEYFQGMMDEVAIWVALEQTQQQIQINSSRGLIGSEIGLVAYYRLNQGAGTFINDEAPSEGNSAGILHNGVEWVPGVFLRPAVMTKRASGIISTSGLLKGVGNPCFSATTSWFEWGTSSNYGNVTLLQALGAAASNTNFSQTVTGLIENVTYHFHAAASNSLGVSFGEDDSFVATSTNLITGRMYHTATLLPNGKVLITGGTDRDFEPLASAELYDPITTKLTPAHSMGNTRYQHTATLLPNGKVLVTGGKGSYPDLFASAELYDPATDTWTPTGSMQTNRYAHSATLLRNGKVLVAGGENYFGLPSSTELYDSATGAWTTNAALINPRFFHTATLLTNGEVLVSGGIGTNSSLALSAAERFNPVTGTWTVTGSMTTNRYAHSATVLLNGKVLAVGGSSRSTFLASAELYDPVAGTWTATGSMLNYRFGLTATMLPSGRVLASGNGIGVPSLYNPQTGTWADVPGPDPSSFATATLLPNGNVFIAGGMYFVPWPDAQVYVHTNIGSWAATPPLANPRYDHTATVIPDGRVLVAGFTNSELYNPTSGMWSNTAPLNTQRSVHRATLLRSGKVLVSGGYINGIGGLSSAELYDPAAGTWTNTGSMNTLRGSHSATLLANGKILVAGGLTNSFFGPTPLFSAELYDPASQTWSFTGSMNTNRAGHTATLLANGKVLVAGGGLASAELYDPMTGVWTFTGSMTTNRAGHSATLLPNGKVLVAGGNFSVFFSSYSSAEIYDPATGVWTATAPMNGPRASHTATLLPNGKVLVTRGYSVGYLASAEVYDPFTGAWTVTATTGAATIAPTANLLVNGKVLLVGGWTGNGGTNRAELYDLGLGFVASQQPQVLSVSSPVLFGGSLVITGAQFRGVSEGSGGCSGVNSPADYPLVQLRSLESEQTCFLLSTNWSTNTFLSGPAGGLPAGWTMATVFVNAIPGRSGLFNLTKQTATLSFSNLVQVFDGTARSASVTTVPPGLGVNVTYNGSPNAPTNVGSYTVIGTIADPNYESTSVTNTLVIIVPRDFGMDVSHFQGESGVSQAAWNQMFAEGKRFVFIKATEGLTGPHDPTMATNVARATAAGLLVGVYHFAHPENRPTTNGAAQEASNMVVYAGSAIGPGRLRPVLDLEGSAATLSTAALTDWAIAFSAEIIARRGPGAAPIIYCSQNFANNELDSRLATYDLWLRTVGSGANPAIDDPPGQGFADSTGVFNNWSFWQYSATGSSGGISPLDLDVCHGEFKPLSSYIILAPPPSPIQLGGLSLTGSGPFQFSFTNTPGALFTVLATTNLTLPLSNWTVLGTVTEGPPGQFNFTDTQATNNPQRYYRVRSP